MSNIKQPQNVIAKYGTTVMGALEWNPGFAVTHGMQFNAAQRFVDSEVLRLSEPYIPFQTSMLQKLGILGTVIGSGEAVWRGPYARYLYYGKVMVGRAPKKLTDIALTFHGEPKRGAFWFERMKADHKNAILTGARRIATGGGI